MVPCHSCYIYETWRSKEVVRGEILKSSHGGGGASHKGRGPTFMPYSIWISWLQLQMEW